MRKYYLIIFLMLFYWGIFASVGGQSSADSPLAKELTINQIKITGDEFLVLHNSTASNMNLGNYWLQYYNDFNLANQGVSNSSQQLPAVILQPNQEILLAVGSAANCGQVWVSKLSFSLKDSAGLIEIVGLSQNAGIVSYKAQDQVTWSSKTTDAVDIKGVSTSATAQIWYRNANGWQSSVNPIGCTATGGTSSSTGTASTLTRLSTSPPSIALGDAPAVSSTPTANTGLAAPQISEILPNPASPQTDATDEFIELYNPNDAVFDLGGYVLRSGTTTFHNYTFPAGQFYLQPHEFRAFFAPQTSLALSNSGSQVALLDPNGDVLAETGIYDTAKDGYAWVFVGGTWQWTTVASPDASNVISAPVAKTSSKSKTLAATSKKSTKTAKKSTSKTSTGNSYTNAPFSTQPPTGSKLHPLVLAGIAAAALLYACYEYRHDIANQVYRLRRDRKAGRELGQIA